MDQGNIATPLENFKNPTTPKNWTELTDSERIERLRNIVKDLKNLISEYNRTNYNLRRKLAAHEHIDGKVVEVKQIKDYDDELYNSGIGGLMSIAGSENIFI